MTSDRGIPKPLGSCGDYDKGGHYDLGLCCIDGDVCDNDCKKHEVAADRQFRAKGFDIGGMGIGGSGRGPGG